VFTLTCSWRESWPFVRRHAKGEVMRKEVCSLILFAGISAGCAAQNSATAPAPAPAAKKSSIAPTPVAAPAPTVLERRIGDYVVHLISGTFRKQPATLTERVVGREDGAWIIELKLEDPASTKTLHAFIDDSGEVRKVTELTAKGEQPAKLSDYEALLAAVSVVPDENEGFSASKTGTCMVGPAELDCETKSYRVRLGERDANLGITHSPSLPGTDIAGEITLADGTVIFRSELVDRGNDIGAAEASFALLRDAGDGSERASK
jgi:hypothetical protein